MREVGIRDVMNKEVYCSIIESQPWQEPLSCIEIYEHQEGACEIITAADNLQDFSTDLTRSEAHVINTGFKSLILHKKYQVLLSCQTKNPQEKKTQTQETIIIFYCA